MLGMAFLGSPRLSWTLEGPAGMGGGVVQEVTQTFLSLHEPLS